MIFVVAIDGTAASGKGTLGKKIAEHFDFHYLDTCLLYTSPSPRDVEESRMPSSA